VRERLIFGPMRDRLQGVLVALTRLPGKIRHLSREMHNMLSRPAAYLENKTLIRQYLLEYLGNGTLVAFRRWTDEAVSGMGASGFAKGHSYFHDNSGTFLPASRACVHSRSL